MTLKHGCHRSGQGEIICKVNEKLGNFIFQGRKVETLKQKRHHLTLYRLSLLRDSILMIISLVARPRAVLSLATRMATSMDTCLGTNLGL